MTVLFHDKFSYFEKFVDGTIKLSVRVSFMISFTLDKLWTVHKTVMKCKFWWSISFSFEKFVDGNNKTVRGMQVFVWPIQIIVHDKFLLLWGLFRKLNEHAFHVEKYIDDKFL
jgi:hypothetical protein